MIYFTENIKQENPLTYGKLAQVIRYNSSKSSGDHQDIWDRKTEMMKKAIEVAKEKHPDEFKKHLIMGFVSDEEVKLIIRKVTFV